MQKTETAQRDFDVVVVGGGSAGIGVTASLLRRRPGLRIAVIEPSDNHYYQPAWTLVGGGAFDVAKTVRPTQAVMPARATWLRAAVAGFEPESDTVRLADGRAVSYRQLIVCGTAAGLGQVEGLSDTLGKHGVSSNYRYDLAPYTWELVRGFQGGQALFTQPAMPIKCAGAPQKAMYLACDHWLRTGVLGRAQVQFDLAGAALFGVPTFVPPLMRYVERYGIALNFNSTLVAVDGPARKAWFDVKNAEGQVSRVERTSTCCTRCRRNCRMTSCATTRWPTPPAGARWIRPRCAIRATPMSSAWATPSAPATPRRRPPRASRSWRWPRT